MGNIVETNGGIGYVRGVSVLVASLRSVFSVTVVCMAMTMFPVLEADGAEAVVGNPVSARIGHPVGDPHMIEWKGRLYLFAGHDFAPESKDYDLRDWWVWSTSDLLEIGRASCRERV